jgi:hypothetical protein
VLITRRREKIILRTPNHASSHSTIPPLRSDLSGGCFVVVVVSQSSMRSCIPAQRRTPCMLRKCCARIRPKLFFGIFDVHIDSNTVVRSIDLQGKAEGGKDTDGEEASAVAAGDVETRSGARTGSGGGGLTGGRRSGVAAGG